MRKIVSVLLSFLMVSMLCASCAAATPAGLPKRVQDNTGKYINLSYNKKNKQLTVKPSSYEADYTIGDLWDYCLLDTMSQSNRNAALTFIFNDSRGGANESFSLPILLALSDLVRSNQISKVKVEDNTMNFKRNAKGQITQVTGFFGTYAENVERIDFSYNTNGSVKSMKIGGSGDAYYYSINWYNLQYSEDQLTGCQVKFSDGKDEKHQKFDSQIKKITCKTDSNGNLVQIINPVDPDGNHRNDSFQYQNNHLIQILMNDSPIRTMQYTDGKLSQLSGKVIPSADESTTITFQY